MTTQSHMLLATRQSSARYDVAVHHPSIKFSNDKKNFQDKYLASKIEAYLKFVVKFFLLLN